MPNLTPLSPNLAFFSRMKREGREHEYRTRAKVHADAGVNKKTIPTIVRKEMDYLPDAEELRLHQEYQVERQAKLAIEQEAKLARLAEKEAAKPAGSTPPTPDPEPVASIPVDRAPTDAERKFLSSLPNNVKYRDEVRWVRNHPKMLEKVQSKDGNWKLFAITLADIKTPMHGPAPSKHAVQMLKINVQNPEKFFEKTHSEMLKWDAEDEGEIDAAEIMDDLTQVQAMIREATKNTRVKSPKPSTKSPD